MSTFQRFKTVVSANVNAALDKAEDPARILAALIREMEDTLEQARVAIAEALAEQKRLRRLQQRLADEIPLWARRAEEALQQNRDELAREALQEKLALEQKQQQIQRDLQQLERRIDDAQQDIQKLKARLKAAREKQQQLQQSERQRPPVVVSRAERVLQQVDQRFEQLEARMEKLEARMESYALVEEAIATPPAPPADPLVEAELEALKQRVQGGSA